MKKLLLLAIIITGVARAHSQIDIGELLLGGSIKDANVLTEPFLRPYGEMLGSSLNSGWYTSAKPHKVLGFDITITGAYTMSPSSATSFDLAKYESQLGTLELTPGQTNSITPTIAGEMSDRPSLRAQGDFTGLSEFEMPDGTGIDFLVTPMVTFGVGLPMGIEVKGRFAPQIKLGDAGKLGLWGLGVQKDIKDYIPGLKHVPVLNLSVLAGYTNFSGTADVGNVENSLGGYLLENGSLDLSSNAFTTRLLIGANLPVVAFYTGLGYGRSSTDFEVLGEYGIGNGEHIKVSYSTNSFDMNIGMRIRLGVIAFHADYTLGEYSAITGGFGINFR